MLWIHKDGTPCREMNQLGIRRDITLDYFDPDITLRDIIRAKITTNFVCGAFRYLSDSWRSRRSDAEFQMKIAKVLMYLILGQYVGERIDPSELESMERYVMEIKNMLVSLARDVGKVTIKQINAGLSSLIGKAIVVNENSLTKVIQKIISEKTSRSKITTRRHKGLHNT